MAIRRVAVRPDPQTGMVTREAHIQAFMDLEAMVWMAGGVGSVIVDRARTDVPGEMVTTYAVVEWKDRTDAKPSPEAETHALAELEQPEQQTDLNPLTMLAEQIGLPVEEILSRLAQPPAAAQEAVAVAANGATPEGDDDEPEEDLSSIPEHLR